jgi:hypothetical protein
MEYRRGERVSGEIEAGRSDIDRGGERASEREKVFYSYLLFPLWLPPHTFTVLQEPLAELFRDVVLM